MPYPLPNMHTDPYGKNPYAKHNDEPCVDPYLQESKGTTRMIERITKMNEMGLDPNNDDDVELFFALQKRIEENKEASKKPKPSNLTLTLSDESMDALFVDLLDNNLELILNPDVKFIHSDDYDNNVTLAHSIMTLMRYQKDAFVFEKWFNDVYWSMLNKYVEKYEELTSEEDEK